MIRKDEYPITVYGMARFLGFEGGKAKFKSYPYRSDQEMGIPPYLRHAEEAVKDTQLGKDPRILADLASWRDSNIFAYYQEPYPEGESYGRPRLLSKGSWAVLVQSHLAYFEDECRPRVIKLTSYELIELLARKDTVRYLRI